MLVIDASLVVAALIDRGRHGRWAHERLGADQLAALPHASGSGGHPPPSGAEGATSPRIRPLSPVRISWPSACLRTTPSLPVSGSLAGTSPLLRGLARPALRGRNARKASGCVSWATLTGFGSALPRRKACRGCPAAWPDALAAARGLALTLARQHGGERLGADCARRSRSQLPWSLTPSRASGRLGMRWEARSQAGTRAATCSPRPRCREQGRCQGSRKRGAEQAMPA